ncbi:MAG: phosphoribosylamine--glycine ligase [Deltaproteobacteria bacterium]|nr:phosphoribosylamine--glycine ligase [Deltaproteobacteria bacterium]
MRILLVGSGGREHALAWKLNKSPLRPEIFIAPGNGGTAKEGSNIPVASDDVTGLMELVARKKIDLVIPGPELPLVLGLADACARAGVLCFGPGAKAAALEGSKSFAKRLMLEIGVPTADCAVFRDHGSAVAHVRSRGVPLVIKADGLASGKGVVVARTPEAALEALEEMMVRKRFGRAGESVLIEELLEGEEASFLAFCQGETAVPLPIAQDHKAVNDGDSGPNTGGMGAYSPVPALPDSRQDDLVRSIILPVLRKMQELERPYSGILYAGLMLTARGPKVVEFNVRFGDPECQPLLMRLEDDPLAVMLACAEGRLHNIRLRSSPQSAVCVVLAAEGYPGDYPRGMPVTGIEDAEALFPSQLKVFQAGTVLTGDIPVAAGGRVLGVTALGDDLTEARSRTYAALEKIHMENSHFRRDIAHRGLRGHWF